MIDNQPIPGIDDDPIRQIRVQVRKAQILEETIRQSVMFAVRTGCTWKEVGEALGTSGQAAWQRYRPDPVPTPKRSVRAVT